MAKLTLDLKNYQVMSAKSNDFYEIIDSCLDDLIRDKKLICVTDIHDRYAFFCVENTLFIVYDKIKREYLVLDSMQPMLTAILKSWKE